MKRLVKLLKLAALVAAFGALAGQDIRAQDFRAQDFRAQDFHAPDFHAPDFRAPDIRASDLCAPDFHAPDFRSQDIRAQDGDAALQVQGDAAAVHLELRGIPIKDVLGALSGTFNVSFRSAVVLDEIRDGTYQGSLRQVITRVLDGYNYVIKYDDSKLEVIVFETAGKQAVPAPQNPVQRREVANRGSRGGAPGAQ